MNCPCGFVDHRFDTRIAEKCEGYSSSIATLRERLSVITDQQSRFPSSGGGVEIQAIRDRMKELRNKFEEWKKRRKRK